MHGLETKLARSLKCQNYKVIFEHKKMVLMDFNKIWPLSNITQHWKVMETIFHHGHFFPVADLNHLCLCRVIQQIEKVWPNCNKMGFRRKYRLLDCYRFNGGTS